MGITSYRIDKIEGKADKRGGEAVDVKESFAITGTDKKNQNMIEVSWSFDVDYKAVGKISLAGTLVYFADSLADKYEEKTAKGKKGIVLKGPALREVSNFILRRGIIECVVVAKELQLPAPIQLPSVRVEQKKA